jgi:DNA mismatch repair protein MutS
LQAIGDCERILARVALKTARPRDLSRLREVFAELPALQQSMKVLQTEKLRTLATDIGEFPALHELLTTCHYRQSTCCYS